MELELRPVCFTSSKLWKKPNHPQKTADEFWDCIPTQTVYICAAMARTNVTCSSNLPIVYTMSLKVTLNKKTVKSRNCALPNKPLLAKLSETEPGSHKKHCNFSYVSGPISGQVKQLICAKMLSLSQKKTLWLDIIYCLLPHNSLCMRNYSHSKRSNRLACSSERYTCGSIRAIVRNSLKRNSEACRYIITKNNQEYFMSWR